LAASVEKEKLTTRSMAASTSLRDRSSSACGTGMGTQVPSITSCVTRSGARAAASSAISEPMLWPASAARCTPAASISASTQSAMASTLFSAGPSLRMWPGRSTASTPWPWWAKKRASSVHTQWSFSAPWMNTTQGRLASKGLPPV
jgi:hypothetical protein